MISAQRVQELEAKCKHYRIKLIELLHRIQTGHPGGSLSCTEIITTLYNEKMNIDAKNPKAPNRDRFVLSKGHAAPMLYLNLAHIGFFPTEELVTLRQLNSRLQGHPCASKTPGVDISTGPLGLGLSAGLGMAMAGRLSGLNYYTYVVLGDGEIQEGAIWEATLSAAKFKASRLIAILDHNGVQLDGTNEEIMPLGNISMKFESFDWNVIKCDGHDIASLSNAVDEAKAKTNGPTIIIAETVKGKGVSFMESKSAWHGKPINDEEFVAAMIELGGVQA